MIIKYININITDIKNNTASNYFYNDSSIINDDKNNHNTISINKRMDRLKTEMSNHKNKNLIIHRNSEYKTDKFKLIKESKTENNNIFNENNDMHYNNENDLPNNGYQKIKINRKNIFPKKSENSIKNAININNKNIQNININEINKRNNNFQILNNSKIKNSYNIEDKNINSININNSSNLYSKNLNSDKKAILIRIENLLIKILKYKI